MNKEDLGHWGRLQASPNVKFTKIHKVLFIGKIKDAARLGVRSIACNVLDLNPVCAWSHTVRSIARNYSRNPRRKCEAMAARATRGSWLMWSALDRGLCDQSLARSILVPGFNRKRASMSGSSAIVGTPKLHFLVLFHPLTCIFTTRTCSTTKY